MDKKDILRSGCEQLGIPLNDRQEKQFLQYYELLKEWNKVMNLTAITEYEDVMEKHFVDSVSLAREIDFSGCETLIDVGTGAGFPGLPIKIIYPHIKVVLLDSLNKRIKFLNTVVENLELSEVTAIHGRAEDVAKDKKYREQFDICVSRAVANLSSLSEYCLPFVKKGGIFVSYKSGSVEEEAEQANNAVKMLGGKINRIEKFVLPNSVIERSFIIIDKKKETPGRYPRKAGIPVKEPLR